MLPLLFPGVGNAMGEPSTVIGSAATWGLAPETIMGAVAIAALLLALHSLRLRQVLQDREHDLSNQQEETRHARQAQRYCEGEAQDLLNSVPASIALLDGEGVIRRVNAQWDQFATDNGNNDPRQVSIGANYLDVCRQAMHQGDALAGECLNGLNAVRTGGCERFDLEYPCHAPGHERWFLMRAVPTRALDHGILISHIDITARKHSERALRESNDQLNAITRSAYDAIVMLDRQGRVRFWNLAAERMFGYAADEIYGQIAHELLAPEPVRAFVHQTFAPLPADPERSEAASFESVAVRKNGKPFPIELYLTATEVNEVRHVVVMARDISERKQAEEQSRLQSSALAAAANAIVITDHRGDIIWCNPAATRLTGYALEEMRGQNPRVLKSGVHNEELYQTLWSTIASGRTWHGEIINRRKDGRLYHEEMTITPVTERDGKITHYVAVKQDVSDRKRMEAEREDHLRFLNTLIDTIPCAIFYKNVDGRYLGCNETFLAWNSCTREQITGTTVEELFPSSIAQRYREMDDTLLREGGRQSYEYQLTGKDGTVRDVLFDKATYTDQSGRIAGIVGVVTDISERKQMEETLREAHGQIQSVLDAATQVAIIATDNEGTITLFNTGAERMLGYRAEDIVDRETPMALHLLPEVEQRARELAEELGHPVDGFDAFVAYARRGGFDAREWTYLRSDGTPITVYLVVTALRGPNGDIVGFLGVAEDVTNRKEAEEALAQERSRLRCLIDSIPDLIFFKDIDGRYLGCNKAFERYVGRNKAQIIGQTDYDLVDAQTADNYRHHDQVALFGGVPRNNEEWVEYPNGSRILLDTVKALFLDHEDRPVGVLGVSRDITERKQVETELSDAKTHVDEINRQLARSNDQLTEAIERAKALATSAESANQAKSEFLANMSHELRTPLHGILSFAAFGIRKHQKASRDTLLSYFERIQASGETLLELLNDLLDLAKHEAGRMIYELQELDLVAHIDAVLEEFALQARDRSLTLELIRPDHDVPVRADLSKLKQVVRNLLSNAVKFSPPDGAIVVSVADTQDTVTVHVRDEGPGIPDEELDAVFDKFVQSSKTKSGAGGTGLGLAICREIIESHHGRIWAANGDEGGAAFTFEMPRNQPPISQEPLATITDNQAAT